MSQKPSSSEGRLRGDRRRRREQHVYGLNSNKSYYKQETNETYALRLVVIGIVLVLLIAFMVLYVEASR